MDVSNRKQKAQKHNHVANATDDCKFIKSNEYQELLNTFKKVFDNSKIKTNYAFFKGYLKNWIISSNLKDDETIKIINNLIIDALHKHNLLKKFEHNFDIFTQTILPEISYFRKLNYLEYILKSPREVIEPAKFLHTFALFTEFDKTIALTEYIIDGFNAIKGLKNQKGLTNAMRAINQIYNEIQKKYLKFEKTVYIYSNELQDIECFLYLYGNQNIESKFKQEKNKVNLFNYQLEGCCNIISYLLDSNNNDKIKIISSLGINLSDILRNVVKFRNSFLYFKNKKDDLFDQFKNLIEYLSNEKFIDKIKDSDINISEVLDEAGKNLDAFDKFKKLLECKGLVIKQFEEGNKQFEEGNEQFEEGNEQFQEGNEELGGDYIYKDPDAIDYGSESVQDYYVNRLG